RLYCRLPQAVGVGLIVQSGWTFFGQNRNFSTGNLGNFKPALTKFLDANLMQVDADFIFLHQLLVTTLFWLTMLSKL
ncbi:hypothetical protein, partial [Calderihabitans maritimus]